MINDLLHYIPTLMYIFNAVVITYIIVVTLFYCIAAVISLRRVNRERKLHDLHLHEDVADSPFMKPISIIVPAYNEEAGIIGSVRSLLSGLNYPQYEVIVVNDGSKDGTLQKMIAEFQMKPIYHKVFVQKGELRTKPIVRYYESLIYPKLTLVDKVNGGKADALNAGINVSQYPYFVSLDGDTILDYNAFLKMMKSIMEAEQNSEIVAAGGTVIIANGSHVERGELKAEHFRLSRQPLIVMQVIEYLRAFLIGRTSLSQYNMLLIISGAFGIFRTDWVVRAGGYHTNTVGEDMELTMRLHRLIKEEKSNARIIYHPDAYCYTEAPDDWRTLHRQRTRWHRGTFESLWAHRIMMLNPKYGLVGLVAMPYFLIVELLGPAVELLGYVTLLYLWYTDALHSTFTWVLFWLMLCYGSLLSLAAVLYEEWRMRKYTRIIELMRLLFYALSESFWYRPIMTLFRFQGLLQALRGKQHGWGEMTRRGVSK